MDGRSRISVSSAAARSRKLQHVHIREDVDRHASAWLYPDALEIRDVSFPADAGRPDGGCRPLFRPDHPVTCPDRPRKLVNGQATHRPAAMPWFLCHELADEPGRPIFAAGVSARTRVEGARTVAAHMQTRPENRPDRCLDCSRCVLVLWCRCQRPVREGFLAGSRGYRKPRGVPEADGTGLRNRGVRERSNRGPAWQGHGLFPAYLLSDCSLRPW